MDWSSGLRVPQNAQVIDEWLGAGVSSFVQLNEDPLDVVQVPLKGVEESASL